MKEKIEVKGTTESTDTTGAKKKIITWNPATEQYKTYIYPHDKELTKARIREFLDDFEVSFPKYLDIPEGEKE